MNLADSFRLSFSPAFQAFAASLFLLQLLQSAPRPLHVYDFGGLDKLTPEQRVEVVASSGFDGLVLKIENAADLENLPRHLARCGTPGGPRILSVFVRYGFVNPAQDVARYQEVVRLLEGRGIALWIILDNKRAGITPAEAEEALAKTARHAISRGVPVSLYPHSRCYISDSESGFALIEKLKVPELKLVVHLCHELRARNGARLPEVISRVRTRVSALSISGAAAEVDFTTPLSTDTTTIRPLDQSEFKWQDFIAAADAAGLQVPVAFINFKIKGDPAEYLPRSLAAWRKATDKPSGPASPDVKGTEASPYDAPDQAVWHAESGSWFISNLGGGISLAKDGNGWITKTDAQGRVLAARWLDKLDAPTGMVAAGSSLYVCDRGGLLEVDIASAREVRTFALPGAEFINDVARTDAGDLFVSDFFGNRIYWIPAETGVPEVFVEGEQLDTPDGLLVDGPDLIVATWGRLSDRATFATSKLGKLLRVSLSTRQISPVVSGMEEIGNLEGIVKVKDFYYVTDWMSGRLLRISPTGVEVVLSGLHHPTDPGFSAEHSTVAIPDHGTNRVLFLRVP